MQQIEEMKKKWALVENVAVALHIVSAKTNNVNKCEENSKFTWFSPWILMYSISTIMTHTREQSREMTDATGGTEKGGQVLVENVSDAVHIVSAKVNS